MVGGLAVFLVGAGAIALSWGARDLPGWEVGAPWEEAMRLTHHPGNDQWPALWLRPAG